MPTGVLQTSASSTVASLTVVCIVILITIRQLEYDVFVTYLVAETRNRSLKTQKSRTGELGEDRRAQIEFPAREHETQDRGIRAKTQSIKTAEGRCRTDCGKEKDAGGTAGRNAGVPQAETRACRRLKCGRRRRLTTQGRSFRSPPRVRREHRTGKRGRSGLRLHLPSANPEKKPRRTWHARQQSLTAQQLQQPR